MDILFIDIDGVLNTYSKLSANAVWENGKLHDYSAALQLTVTVLVRL